MTTPESNQSYPTPSSVRRWDMIVVLGSLVSTIAYFFFSDGVSNHIARMLWVVKRTLNILL
jgi:hypothetical protein